MITDNIDTIEKRIRVLFSKCARNEMPSSQADEEYNETRSEYYKILEDADEKVHLANQMYDLVDRYLRRLDSELFKFKCELEADHNGITEILEKRSLELEGGSNSMNLLNNTPNIGSQKENRMFGMVPGSNNMQSHREKYRPRPEKRRNSSTSSGPPEKRPAPSTPSTSTVNIVNNVHPPTPSIVLPTPTPPALQTTVPYNLQHIAAGNAIAAAASQAIVATQQMQQGRRTASLKASYEAIHGTTANAAHELLIGRELTGAAHNAIQAVEREGSAFSNQRRHKK